MSRWRRLPPPHRIAARAWLVHPGSLTSRVIARHGAELILHGHNHKPSLHRLPGPGAATPVVGVASASARPGGHYPGAAYNLYEIEREADGVRISLRRRGLNDAGEVVELESVEL